MLFLSHSYSRVIFLRRLRCAEFDFQVALGSGPASAGRPHAAYRGHGWWRGAGSCLLKSKRVWPLLGHRGLLGPVLSSLPVSPARSAVRGPLMRPLWRVPGPLQVSRGSQRPPGLPEAQAANQHSTRPRVPCMDSITGCPALCCAGPCAPLLHASGHRPGEASAGGPLACQGHGPAGRHPREHTEFRQARGSPPCLPHLQVSVPAPPTPVGGLLPTSALVGVVGTSPPSPPSALGRRWPPVGAAPGLDVDALS